MRKEKAKGKGCYKLNEVGLSRASLIILIALALSSYAFECNVSSTPSTFQVGREINITFNDQIPIDAIRFYAEIYAYSTSTANSSSSALLANISNTTERRWINFTLGSPVVTELEDGNDYTIGACVWNGSTTASQGATNFTCCANNQTSRVFDRTAPQLATTLSPSGVQTSRTNTFQGVVNGANTTSCTLNFIGKNLGSNFYTMTHSGNNCSVVFTNVPETVLVYSITTSDGTNTSVSAEQTMRVEIRTATAKKAYIISGGKLPTQASATAQQRAFGQQAQTTLDRVIAKAPPQAQKGLAQAKESITKQYKGREAVKTWTGTGLGCALGLAGLVIPPVGLVTIPAGCGLGHILGMVA